MTTYTITVGAGSGANAGYYGFSDGSDGEAPFGSLSPGGSGITYFAWASDGSALVIYTPDSDPVTWNGVEYTPEDFGGVWVVYGFSPTGPFLTSGTSNFTVPSTAYSLALAVKDINLAPEDVALVAVTSRSLALEPLNISLTPQPVALRASRYLYLQSKWIVSSAEDVSFHAASTAFSFEDINIQTYGPPIVMRVDRRLAMGVLDVSVAPETVGLAASWRMDLAPLDISLSGDIALKASRRLALGGIALGAAMELFGSSSGADDEEDDMTVPWPETLPCQPEQGTWSEAPQSDVLAFRPESGPAILRRRSTVQGVIAQSTWVFTAAQYATFRTFYRTDLQGGAIRFSLDHPLTGEATEWVFEAEPQMTAMTNRKVRVQMQWRGVS